MFVAIVAGTLLSILYILTPNSLILITAMGRLRSEEAMYRANHSTSQQLKRLSRSQCNALGGAGKLFAPCGHSGQPGAPPASPSRQAAALWVSAEMSLSLRALP